jgi:hypothetical protein
MRATPTGLNTTIAWLFGIGSCCFAAGSVPAYVNAVGGWIDGVTYAVGSVFFTSASLLQLLQSQTPGMTDPDARPERTVLRWWAWLPQDRGWWAAVTQFPGTLCFNVSTFAALIHNATVAQELRYVWRPDLYGSILFLVSSGLAISAVHAARSARRSLPWWIAWVNMLGSVFFMASALAAYLLPSGDVLNTRISVLGTLLGAVCFLIGAALMPRAWRTEVSAADARPRADSR